jgi:hypothetical protein
MFFKKALRSAETGDRNKTLSLIDAARWAYQKALSEGLSLAYIAEQSGRPQYWFANSILNVVEVLGLRPGENSPQVLTRDLVAGLKLADDMSALTDADGQPEFSDLSVTDEQFERYMAWARTVY